jgi:hypothetical protein
LELQVQLPIQATPGEHAKDAPGNSAFITACSGLVKDVGISLNGSHKRWPLRIIVSQWWPRPEVGQICLPCRSVEDVLWDMCNQLMRSRFF